MQISLTNPTPTKAELTITADEKLLAASHAEAVKQLGKNVQVAGFRKGHAPASVVEKAIDQQALQTKFLDIAVSQMYAEAVVDKKIRAIGQPNVTVTKYVPYTELEVKAEVDAVGEVKLPDYKKLKHKVPTVKVEDAEIEAVIDDLLARDATKSPVKRAAKDGDEVVMDFSGVDAKSKKAIAGADGKEYPIIIGSSTFIPGFEPELIGLKKDGEKTFDITFPKDYGAKALQNKKVSFTVKIQEVREVKLPKLDDTFATKVGPFKSVAELRGDIRKQLQAEKERQAVQQTQNALLEDLAAKSKAEIPESLIDSEIERMIAEEKQTILYRGVTWPEYLKGLGETEGAHRTAVRSQAELRVKSGICLGEAADKEGITVTEEELAATVEQLKAQYKNDTQMQAELEKPENIRDISSRILTEKTLERLLSFSAK